MHRENRSPAIPVRHALNEARVRTAAREVWMRLDPAAKATAVHGRSPRKRVSYRYSLPRRRRSPRRFMPRDPYLSQVQAALEARIAAKAEERIAAGPIGSAALAMPSATDEIFQRFGPDDWRYLTKVVQEGLELLGAKREFGRSPVEHRLSDRVRIVLVGDWGTGTEHAQTVARRMAARIEESEAERHLIHLGDVYYCGLPEEYADRFLKYWPVSKDDVHTFSWNLNGNHDMYSGGSGYFDLISGQDKANPEGAEGEMVRGARDSGYFDQQGTSFFRLYNDHWQVIGLDTAYVDNDLHDGQIPWLERWVGVEAAERHKHPDRRTILLTHHQLGSAREKTQVGAGIREKTARVREEGEIHAWFWGHEHRCLLYEPYLGVACPVCTGNGGVPVLLTHRITGEAIKDALMKLWASIKTLLRPGRRARPPQIRYQPPSPDPDEVGLRWEKLGFVVIDLDGQAGRACYFDEDDRPTEIDLFTAGPRT